MRYDFLVEHVRARTGASSDEAAKLVAATLASLGAALPGAERRGVIDAMPPALASGLGAHRGRELLSKTDLFARVAEATKRPFGEAAEEVEVVC
ncbi:MAG: DUF2267 domain-containing protein, partial [Polyangiaceae bacterium]|nr:DUF2267 domain-containing protein [Polyangiaceae bacterium]